MQAQDITSSPWYIGYLVGVFIGALVCPTWTKNWITGVIAAVFWPVVMYVVISYYYILAAFKAGIIPGVTGTIGLIFVTILGILHLFGVI